METTKKMTASEKYNKFIDYQGLSRTVENGKEIAWRIDADSFTAAWNNLGTEEYFCERVILDDLRADYSAFRKLAQYELNNGCDPQCIYNIVKFFVCGMDIEASIYVPYLIACGAVDGIRFMNDI